MFLLTIITSELRIRRKTFLFLQDAEEYIDYHANLGWTPLEFDRVDTTLSDMFCTDQV